MPERFHSARYDGLEQVVDTDTIAEGMQLRPDGLEEFLAWTEADLIDGPINGGPAVVLAGRRPVIERVVGLGDYAVRIGESWRAERGSGFYQRFVPVED